MNAATITLWYQWMAISILFLVGSIWSEDNVRYGYVLVPFLAGLFYWIGWLQFTYLPTVIPILIMLGVLAYMRAHLKYKFGVFGSSGGMLWKVFAFCVFLQFAIIFANGLAIFDAKYIDNPQNEFVGNGTQSGYSITTAQNVYGSQTYGLDIMGAIEGAWQMVWTSFKVLWSMIEGFFNIYPTMVTSFKMPAQIATVISAGVYLLVALEVFILIFKPYRIPEI